MIDGTTVSSGEYGLIRLFAIDLPADQIADFATATSDKDGIVAWPFKEALGAKDLDPTFVEVFDVDTLDGVGLVNYLTAGNGVAEKDVAPYAAMLKEMSGAVAVVTSSAFGGTEQVLTPKQPLRLIATFREDGAEVNFEHLPDPGALDMTDVPPTPEKPSDAAMSGRVATIALLVMALLVGLMIWVAG